MNIAFFKMNKSNEEYVAEFVSQTLGDTPIYTVKNPVVMLIEQTEKGLTVRPIPISPALQKDVTITLKDEDIMFVLKDEDEINPDFVKVYRNTFDKSSIIVPDKPSIIVD